MINRRRFFAALAGSLAIPLALKSRTPSPLPTLSDAKEPQPLVVVHWRHEWDGDRDFCTKCGLSRYHCVENDIYHCSHPSERLATPEEVALHDATHPKPAPSTGRGTPAYSFNNDRDTGLYVAANGETKIAIGGKTC